MILNFIVTPGGKSSHTDYFIEDETIWTVSKWQCLFEFGNRRVWTQKWLTTSGGFFTKSIQICTEPLCVSLFHRGYYKLHRSSHLTCFDLRCRPASYQGTLGVAQEVNLWVAASEWLMTSLPLIWSIKLTSTLETCSLNLKQVAITIPLFDYSSVWMWGQLPLESRISSSRLNCRLLQKDIVTALTAIVYTLTAGLYC